MVYAKTITGETVHADHALGRNQDNTLDGNHYVRLVIDTPGQPERSVNLDAHNTCELIDSLTNALRRMRLDTGRV